MAVDNPPILDNPSSGGFMQKKILGLPAPLFIGVVAIGAFIIYRHYKNTGLTSGSSTGVGGSTVDPNAVDPTTGLTYGAEQQAGLNALGGGGSPNGSGTGGVGGSGLSLSDLESLFSLIQGSSTPGTVTNNYYGTPTNPDNPGAGTTSPVSGLSTGPFSGISAGTFPIIPGVSTHLLAPSPTPANSTSAGPATASSPGTTNIGGSPGQPGYEPTSPPTFAGPPQESPPGTTPNPTPPSNPGVAVSAPGAATPKSPGKIVGGYVSGGAIKT